MQPALDAAPRGGLDRAMSDRSSTLPCRRSVVGGLLALGVVPARSIAADRGGLFAGTYANEGGAGLVPLVASGDGWRGGTAIAAIRNVSFGANGARRRLRYLLDEQQQGALGIYDAAFRRLAGASTQGADPCHAALRADGGVLAVANYSSGSVAVWALDAATGLPRGAAQLVRHEGSGPDRERQAAPHAHWVGFTTDGATLHSVDLGADAIFAHRIDPSTGRVADTSIAYRAAPGSGPRHLARHPRVPVAYLVAELANTVTVLRAAPDGTFAKQAVVSTLPADFRGASAAAHIALNAAATRLYVSNRGHDSIAVYEVARDGGLRLLQHVGCGGHWPRFLRLLERQKVMLVANQRAGTITRLPLRRDGTLGSASTIVAVPGVAFIGD
jgi:6-phosphogluconolactonase